MFMINISQYYNAILGFARGFPVTGFDIKAEFVLKLKKKIICQISRKFLVR